MVSWSGSAMLLIATIVLAGCSENFGDKLGHHRDCIGQAQILPGKIDTCLSNTNGHRNNVDRCLSDQMVPDHKIQALNDCSRMVNIITERPEVRNDQGNLSR
jgi:hypothetical protein